MNGLVQRLGALRAKGEVLSSKLGKNILFFLVNGPSGSGCYDRPDRARFRPLMGRAGFRSRLREGCPANGRYEMGFSSG